MIIEYNDVHIGLEAHIPITNVETKLFCSCPNTSRFKPDKPNQYVCPICMGMPGTLPNPNKKAIILAIRAARALNSEISDKIQFYRKHYFYPDLPKGYQITQFEGGGHYPIGRGGYLKLSNGRKIRIRRLHVEEDPARLIHPSGMGESRHVLIDYNRSGNPLIEVVTEPDINTPQEAKDFLEKLKRMLMRIGVLDPDIEVLIRSDVNVSVGSSSRIEIKNIGSATDVEKAISFEVVRIRNYLSQGIKMIQETRHWDERRRVTISIREKEVEAEYRYFPDPNIPVIDLTSLISYALREFPKLEEEVYEELIVFYSLPNEIASVLSKDILLYNIFTKVVGKLGSERDENTFKLVSKLLVNEGRRLLKKGDATPDKLAELLVLLSKMVDEGLLSEDEARRRLLRSSGKMRVEAKMPGEIEIKKYVDDFLREIGVEYHGARLRDYIVGRVIRMMESDGLSPNPSRVARIVDDLIGSRMKSKEPTREKIYFTTPEEYRESLIGKKINVEDAFKIRGGRHILTGWIESRMIVGNKLFIILRDWSGKIQCVSDKSKASYKTLSTLPKESFIEIEGELVRDIRAPKGVEVKVDKAIHLGGNSPLPLTLMDLARSSMNVRLNYRFLDLRRRYVKSIMSFRAKLIKILRRYFYENGFTEINTPKIITTATEGGAELFPILFYGREAFLAQSPQLYKQMSLNMFEKVFEIDSYYRAQKFDTPRHLAEFWSIDVEASLYTLNDLINLIEDMITYLVEKLSEEAEKELVYLNTSLPDVSRPFKRITYIDALNNLGKKGLKVEFGDDLGAEELRYLSKEVSEPYFIVYWPKSIRAFYYKPKKDDPRLTLSFDLMWPLKEGHPLELSSGGERINDPITLSSSLKEKGLYPEAYEWYLDMFRYGMPPHGGFGMGLDRLIMGLLNLPTVLDAVFSPRTPKYSRP